MSDAFRVHARVRDHNWDDGLEPIRELVDSRETEVATALMIWWRLEGPWILRGAANAEAAELNEVVRERLLAGFYRRGELRYSPVEEQQLNRLQVMQLITGGLPTELIEPTWPAPSGREKEKR